jgi:hypothetical protein
MLVGLGLVGCATPNELSQPRTTSEMAQSRSSTMTAEQAQNLLDDLQKKLAADDAQNPLRAPKSLEDVLAVLQSDQIDLFPEAVKFAKAQNNVKGRTLAAQLEGHRPHGNRAARRPEQPEFLFGDGAGYCRVEHAMDRVGNDGVTRVGFAVALGGRVAQDLTA